MNLVWLRNDIRLVDNPALFYACEAAQADNQGVVAVYIATPGQWRQHDESAAKLAFRQDGLNELGSKLAQRGVPLQLLEVDDFQQLPGLLQQFCQQHRIATVWFNEENWVNELARDQAVEALLQAQGVRCRIFANELLVSAERLQNQQQQPYKVFTPWYKRWLARLTEALPETLPAPAAIGPALQYNQLLLPGAGDYRQDIWPAGEDAAWWRLQDFAEAGLVPYAELRDIPGKRGTSMLSPYLANGLISASSCLCYMVEHCRQRGHDWQADPWIRELAWRDFYHYLMIEFPRLGMHQPFKAETLALRWRQDEVAKVAWQQGQTGYPIIDAAMRQLNQTGWMHNRLRMLTASFYTKLLLLHWQGGEQYFMRHLLDGDFASNNGGWQWSASTGCDASPWFRIFNPTKQSERYDPRGHFIRKLVPELATLSDRDIHFPSASQREQLGYPQPIVDYRLARQRVLDRFAELNT